jgi:NAD(P)-dependent dehydrogenase (short-subunit alcohol dehydrogenase family)
LDLQLTDTVAVVVGGAQGIGQAIASEFAAEKAHVAIIDRSPLVEESGREIAHRHGVRVLAFQSDATDEASLYNVARTVIQDLGRCDHVVYAAGVGSGKFGFPFWNLEPADWPGVLEVNLTGAVKTAHAFAPLLRQQHGGTMLFISSVAGQIGSQTDPPYSAAKAGLINFAQCAAKDLAPHDVRVNTICPGMVQTAVNRSVWQAWYNQTSPELRQSYDEWAGEKVKRVAPLGRWQTPRDIAALAIFLASPRAASITGQTMNVDGGQVMHW